MTKDNKDPSKDTEPTVEPTYPRQPKALVDSLIPDEIPAAAPTIPGPCTVPVVDPQQLIEEIEREQGHQTMVICRTPRTRLKLSQMREAIKVNPSHPVAIVFAKAIKSFPDDYPKVFHVEQPDLQALLHGKYVEKDIVTDDDGSRYERKTLVDTPPSKPAVSSLLSSPVNQLPAVEKVGESGPVNQVPPKEAVGESRPKSIPIRKEVIGKGKPITIKPNAPKEDERKADHEIDVAVEAAAKLTKPKTWADPEPIPPATSSKKKTAKKKK